MNDEAAAGAGEAAPSFNIVHQYIKDLSFEVPGAPEVFKGNAAPEVTVNVDVGVNKNGENDYEVVLKIDTRGSLSDGKPLFIIELAYAGLIQLTGVPEDQLQPTLLIEGPRLLFPFARNVVATLTRDGGLPPLMIAPLDFVALYRNRIAQQQAAAGNGNGDGKGDGA